MCISTKPNEAKHVTTQKVDSCTNWEISGDLVEVVIPDEVVVPEINSLDFDVAQIISEFKSREWDSSNTISAVTNSSTPRVEEVSISTPVATDSVLASGQVQESMVYPEPRNSEPHNSENHNPICLCYLSWPPRLPVAYYLNLPNIHYYLWNIPINSPQVLAHLFIEDLSQVPRSVLRGKYCTNKITHKMLTMFNQVLCGLEQYVHHLTKELLGQVSS